jgi:inorganic pyrophosphatase
MPSRMTKYMNVSPGTDIPHVVNAIIEIPQGSRSKFELDKETGLFRLDRYLFSSLHYPGDYGLIPQTLAEDGDPLDVLVMVNEPTFTGCLIETRVVGLFKMKDRDANDFKVFGVPNSDPLFKEFQDLDDVPSHYLKEVEHFLRHVQRAGRRADRDARLVSRRGSHPRSEGIGRAIQETQRGGGREGGARAIGRRGADRAATMWQFKSGDIRRSRRSGGVPLRAWTGVDRS